MHLLKDFKEGVRDLSRLGYKLNPFTAGYIAFAHIMALFSPLAFIFAPEGFASVMLWYLGGYMLLVTLSVTGYTHRLISHKAAGKISLPVHIFWGLLLQSMSCQKSVAEWGGKHVIHHAKVDDPALDPYGVTTFKTPLWNFLWSHMVTHMYTKPLETNPNNPYAKATKAIIRRHPVLGFQKRFYIPLVVLMIGIIPAIIGFFIGGSLWTAFLLAWTSMIGVTLLYHITWTVNSVSHIAGGEQSATSTARNVRWNLFALGEANRHADHHDYACNYCNGFDKAGWLPWVDPTRYMILSMWLLGMLRGLKRPSADMVEVIYAERKLAAARRGLPDTKWQKIAKDVESRKHAFMQRMKDFYVVEGQWKAELKAKVSTLKAAAAHKNMDDLRSDYAELFDALESKLHEHHVQLKDLINALKAQERERLNRARTRMEEAKYSFYESLAKVAVA